MCSFFSLNRADGGGEGESTRTRDTRTEELQMIRLNSKPSRGATSATWFILAAVILCGCAGPKPAPKVETAPPPPPPKPVSLAQVKTELQEAKSQMQATTDSLNKLHKSAQPDAQANYDAFTGEYLKLKSKADGVSKRSEEIKGRASAYFAMWDKQAAVENPELRRQAVQQRAAAERTYNEIVNEMELTRMSFRPYMSNLADAGNYVRGRLNPATLGSMTDLVTKTNEQSKEVASHVDAIVKSIDSISAATGEGAPAAATVPPAPTAPTPPPAGAQ
jgi:hypothetical protein